MELPLGAGERCCHLELENGAVIWSWRMVLPFGAGEWSCHLELENGAVIWSWRTVLSFGAGERCCHLELASGARASIGRFRPIIDDRIAAIDAVSLLAESKRRIHLRSSIEPAPWT